MNKIKFVVIAFVLGGFAPQLVAQVDHKRLDRLKDMVQQRVQVNEKSAPETAVVYAPMVAEAPDMARVDRPYGGGYVSMSLYYQDREQYHKDMMELTLAVNTLTQIIEGQDKLQATSEKKVEKAQKFMDWLYTGGLTALITAFAGLIGAFAFRKKIKTVISDATTDYDKVADHIEKRSK